MCPVATPSGAFGSLGLGGMGAVAGRVKRYGKYPAGFASVTMSVEGSGAESPVMVLAFPLDASSKPWMTE